MSLVAGARLGPYEIIAFIGAGGMGEVYKARDPRLNRIVAIKILPSHNRADSDRQRRLEREAQAVAALAHPHICVLHDIGHHEDFDFLVMEYLDGETLSSRLRQGPLPIDQVIRYATEVADALDNAHRRGVIHRDLTPGNIMLTKGGVKLLDFGLAKWRPAGTASALETSPGDALTAQGTLLGTLPYMAPEQLEGASGDDRTDIFAFGAVLYEMASGRRAFRGDSQASLIHAILHRHPEPLASVQPNVPPELDRLVRKCLAKDPDARWQTASDVADELRWIAGGGGGRATALAESGRHRKVRLTATVTALLLAVVAGTMTWWWRSAVRPGAREVQHQQVTFTGDVEISALSPDGRTVAYVPNDFDRVLMRELDGGRATPIWTGKNVMAVSWLPDGSHLVAIGGDRSVWLVPRLGGTARRLDVSGRMAAPSPDGASLALIRDDLAGFVTLDLAGGEIRHVRLAGSGRVLAIDWHARTNRVVLMTSGDDGKVWTVWSVASDGREQLRLLTGNEFNRAICSSPVSDVVYVMRDQRGSMDLLRVPMYPDPGAVRVLVTGLPTTAMGYRCTLSADGRRLLYGRRASRPSLWLLNFAPPGAEATQLTHGSQDFFLPAVSPDGLWIAGVTGSQFEAQLVKIPVGGGEPVRLGDGVWPVWSPDGQQLAFTSRRSGSPRVWIVGANGELPREVKDSAVGAQRPIWLPDGRLAWQTPDRQNYRIRDLATGRDEYLFKDGSRFGWFDPRFSPRGDSLVLRPDWDGLAWRAGGAGVEAGLLLLSWPTREERFLARHVEPIGWSANGEWIYAIQPGDGQVVRVSARTGETRTTGQFPAGLRVNSCDLTPDRDAIVCSLVEPKSDAWIVEHFDPEIR
jgi:Tol biopolymer transport system component/tRNA A-37 threonylcarbamoyl transferase component Bud32